MYDAIFFTDDTNNLASVPPIGAYKCAHVLRKNNYKCLVVNHFSFFTLEDFDRLIDCAVSDRTKLIAFSTTFLRSVQVERIEGQPTPPFPDIDIDIDTVFPQGKDFENSVIAKIKNKNNRVKFSAGGAKVSPNYANKNINYGLIGYSECSIVNLMDHLATGADLKNSIKNIWGRIIVDDRFAKAYDFCNEDMAWLPTDVVNHKTLPIEVARGCIFKCKFCSYPMNGKQNLDFVKCEKNLKYELEKNYYEHGVSQYILVDDTFNDHEDKLNRIRSIVQSLKFQPIFWGYHRLDLIATRPQTIPILHDIGIRAMYFGIESLNPVTAKIIGKGFDREKQIAALELLRLKYSDISLHGSFIVGLPEENEEQVTDTFNKVISQDVPLHSWAFHPLYIAKQQYATYSSDIDKNYASYGYVDIDSELHDSPVPNWQGKLMGATSKIINWRNQHMDFSKAMSLADQFTRNSYQNKNFHIQGQFAISVGSMNHPEYNFDQVRRSVWGDFDFDQIEHNVRQRFIDEYKQKLFLLIQNQ